ncbi:MAG: hypothetical protein NC923_03610 [Candidatus Omnitrophica bacterium]|nr:hypothetical protein [Candidatus Omnitrophota bacterium]
MTKFNKGDKLVCVPCGREVIIGCCGISDSAILCCGTPMKKKTETKTAKSRKR